MAVEEAPDGGFLRFTCTDSGQASNHVQLWGPKLPVEKGACLLMTLRARSSKPFRFPRMSIRQGSSPWTGFSTAAPVDRDIGPQWEAFKVVFDICESSDSVRLHVNLGKILPEGAVFDFQP